MATYPENVDEASVLPPWWVILLYGIVALILGLFLVTSPKMTILTLVEFLGFYWVVSGIISIVEIFLTRSNVGWKILHGAVGILAGLTVLLNPVASAIFIPSLIALVVAIEGIIIGITSIIRAFKEHSWGMGFLGVLSFLIGLGLLVSPYFGALPLSILFGVLAIIGGVAAIILSFRARAEERSSSLSHPNPTYQQVPVTGPDEKPDSEEYTE